MAGGRHDSLGGRYSAAVAGSGSPVVGAGGLSAGGGDGGAVDDVWTAPGQPDISITTRRNQVGFT